MPGFRSLADQLLEPAPGSSTGLPLSCCCTGTLNVLCKVVALSEQAVGCDAKRQFHIVAVQSSSFSRRASLTSMPPYLLFQV